MRDSNPDPLGIMQIESDSHSRISSSGVADRTDLYQQVFVGLQGADALRDAGADVVMMERDGEHGGAFWREELPLMVT
jgi:hypothetical protein